MKQKTEAKFLEMVYPFIYGKESYPIRIKFLNEKSTDGTYFIEEIGGASMAADNFRVWIGTATNNRHVTNWIDAKLISRI